MRRKDKLKNIEGINKRLNENLNLPPLNELLEECKDVINFHLGSSHSDTGEWEEEIINKIEMYQGYLNRG